MSPAALMETLAPRAETADTEAMASASPSASVSFASRLAADRTTAASSLVEPELALATGASLTGLTVRLTELVAEPP